MDPAAPPPIDTQNINSSEMFQGEEQDRDTFMSNALGLGMSYGAADEIFNAANQITPGDDVLDSEEIKTAMALVEAEEQEIDNSVAWTTEQSQGRSDVTPFTSVDPGAAAMMTGTSTGQLDPAQVQTMIDKGYMDVDDNGTLRATEKGKSLLMYAETEGGGLESKDLNGHVQAYEAAEIQKLGYNSADEGATHLITTHFDGLSSTPEGVQSMIQNGLIEDQGGNLVITEKGQAMLDFNERNGVTGNSTVDQNAGMLIASTGSDPAAMQQMIDDDLLVEEGGVLWATEAGLALLGDQAVIPPA